MANIYKTLNIKSIAGVKTYYIPYIVSYLAYYTRDLIDRYITFNPIISSD